MLLIIYKVVRNAIIQQLMCRFYQCCLFSPRFLFEYHSFCLCLFLQRFYLRYQNQFSIASKSLKWYLLNFLKNSYVFHLMKEKRLIPTNNSTIIALPLINSKDFFYLHLFEKMNRKKSSMKIKNNFRKFSYIYFQILNIINAKFLEKNPYIKKNVRNPNKRSKK